MIPHNIISGPSGPTVLLLHVYPFDHRMWLPAVDRLAGVPILLVNAPSFGESEPPMDTPSLDAYTSQIMTGMGRSGVERIIPVDNSMGGYIALTLLERHPDVVAGLGLLGTRVDAGSVDAKVGCFESLVTTLAEWYEELLTPQVELMFTESMCRARPEIISQAVQRLCDATDEGISWAQRVTASHPNCLSLIVAFHKPVLVTREEDDTIIPPEQTAALVQMMGAGMTEVRDTSRLILIENPGAASCRIMTPYPQCMQG